MNELIKRLQTQINPPWSSESEDKKTIPESSHRRCSGRGGRLTQSSHEVRHLQQEQTQRGLYLREGCTTCQNPTHDSVCSASEWSLLQSCSMYRACLQGSSHRWIKCAEKSPLHFEQVTSQLWTVEHASQPLRKMCNIFFCGGCCLHDVARESWKYFDF